MGRSNKNESGKTSREHLEIAAQDLNHPKSPKHVRLEALGTLLSAYALGSRTATRGLEEYQRRFPAFALPGKEKAMSLASDAFRESEAIKANLKGNETLPGY